MNLNDPYDGSRVLELEQRVRELEAELGRRTHRRFDTIDEARAAVAGLGDIELERLVQACLEGRRCDGRHLDAVAARANSAGYHFILDGRLAPVQGERDRKAGQVAWWEHEAAWRDYARRHGKDQSAERIAQRAGFGYLELVDHLGREPFTWRPR